jgi:hypothetical protein
MGTYNPESECSRENVIFDYSACGLIILESPIGQKGKQDRKKAKDRKAGRGSEEGMRIEGRR